MKTIFKLIVVGIALVLLAIPAMVAAIHYANLTNRDHDSYG